MSELWFIEEEKQLRYYSWGIWEEQGLIEED